MRTVVKFLFFFILFNIVVAKNISNNKINVVGSTTLISSIVKEIGKDKVSVIVIIPSGICPGHFDLPVGIIKHLHDSKIFFYHGWEKWLDKILSNMQTETLKMIKLKTSNSWMVPEINKFAAREIKDYFCEIDVENIMYYEKNLANYIKKVDNISKKIKKDFAKYSGTKVISSVMQKEFLEWIGLEVVKTYGRIEDLNVKDVKELVDVAKKYNVKIVIDNLQSGSNSAKNIAKDINAKHIVLSNFPEDSYFDTLEKNIKKLKEVLR